MGMTSEQMESERRANGHNPERDAEVAALMNQMTSTVDVSVNTDTGTIKIKPAHAAENVALQLETRPAVMVDGPVFATTQRSIEEIPKAGTLNLGCLEPKPGEIVHLPQDAKLVYDSSTKWLEAEVRYRHGVKPGTLEYSLFMAKTDEECRGADVISLPVEEIIRIEWISEKEPTLRRQWHAALATIIAAHAGDPYFRFMGGTIEFIVQQLIDGKKEV